MFTRKITTLSFEGNTIRCLTAQGDQVLKWNTLMLPEDKMSQGVVHDPDLVSQHLKQLLQETQAPKRRVITAATDQRSVHRMMTIPTVDDRFLEETIRRKAKQELALPIDEVDISWKVVRRSEQQLNIYLLAIPKQVIDRQMQTLQQAGVKPRVMDAKPLALIQAANQSTALIINLESYSMAVIIVVRGIPVIVRTVPLESGELTREAKLDLLSQELARTTKFYNESNKQNRLSARTPLFTTGALFDSLQLEDRVSPGTSLIERLRGTTPYRITQLEPPLEIPPRLSRAEYAVNLGLALKT